MEVDAAGNKVWEYRSGADGLLRKPFSAEPAHLRRPPLRADQRPDRLPGLRGELGRRQGGRLAVRDDGRARAPAVNQLADPFCATQSPPGGPDQRQRAHRRQQRRTIASSRSAPTTTSAAAPDLGYSAASIVWQYGVTGQAGSAPGYLNQARSPQRLANGDTLITRRGGQEDHRGAQPATSIRRSRTTATRPAASCWSYANGVDGPLLDPNTARAVESGTLMPARWSSPTATGSRRGCRIIDHDTKATQETIDLAPPSAPTTRATTPPALATRASRAMARCGSPTPTSARSCASATRARDRDVRAARLRRAGRAQGVRPPEDRGAGPAVRDELRDLVPASTARASRRRASRATGATSTSRRARTGKRIAYRIDAHVERIAGRRPCSKG